MKRKLLRPNLDWLKNYLIIWSSIDEIILGEIEAAGLIKTNSIDEIEAGLMKEAALME